MGATSAQNIEGAQIAENKIKRYSIVITIDCMDLKKKKTGTLHLNSEALKPYYAPPLVALIRGPSNASDDGEHPE
jgi:hypothetical protein